MDEQIRFVVNDQVNQRINTNIRRRDSGIHIPATIDDLMERLGLTNERNFRQVNGVWRMRRFYPHNDRREQLYDRRFGPALTREDYVWGEVNRINAIIENLNNRNQ